MTKNKASRVVNRNIAYKREINYQHIDQREQQSTAERPVT